MAETPTGSGANIVATGTRTIGEAGFEVGPLAYGLWRFTTPDVDEAQALIETALDAGMNLIDTADVYGFDWGGTGFGSVEELLGKVLAQAPHLRDRMVLATKGGIVPPIPYDSSSVALRQRVRGIARRAWASRSSTSTRSTDPTCSRTPPRSPPP